MACKEKLGVRLDGSNLHCLLPRHNTHPSKNAAWTPEVLAKFEELRAKGRCVRLIHVDVFARACMVIHFAPSSFLAIR